MKMFHLCALLLATAALTAACSKPPTQPSPPAPGTSTLTFQVAAAAGNPADSGSYTTANATFGASVRTTCVPNPNIANSVCPDLTAVVRAKDGPAFSPPPRQCVMWAFAPIGSTLRVGSYPKAEFYPAGDAAGFFINCARAGTECGPNVSSFTLHELQSNPSGVVTRLHITFEQTCLGGFPPAVGFFGKGSGELWIVDGTAP
jgi:hypothetical protein